MFWCELRVAWPHTWQSPMYGIWSKILWNINKCTDPLCCFHGPSWPPNICNHDIHDLCHQSSLHEEEVTWGPSPHYWSTVWRICQSGRFSTQSVSNVDILPLCGESTWPLASQHRGSAKFWFFPPGSIFHSKQTTRLRGNYYVKTSFGHDN